MSTRLTVAIECFPIAGRFTIARGAKTEAVVVTVSLERDGRVGRGECVPYARYGESVESVVAAIESLRTKLEAGLSREELQSCLPSGAARNAIDCALWDLDAKVSGVPVWKLAGLPPLAPVVTAYTVSLDSPEAMADAARKAAGRPLLKIKLGGKDGDIDRIQNVREAAPQSVLIADANEGWTENNIEAHLRACAAAGFALVEQPLPSGHDELLRSIERPVPICADESVHDRADLDRLTGLYDYVNIKLDKTGGLTEALALAKAAEERGFDLMVGCMVGSSLAMAPALVLATRAKFVDLDGPLLLARDREDGLVFEGSLLHPPSARLWGS